MATGRDPAFEMLEEDEQEIAQIEQDLMQSIESIDPRQLPDELKKHVDFDKLKQHFRDAKSIRILLTGKTGTGKSTLINGILGFNVDVEKHGESIIGKPETSVTAKQGDSIEHGCTTEVTEYKIRKGSVDVTLWDSPGLLDGTKKKTQDEYLAQMKAKCVNRDLTIFCINISETRFVCSTDDNPDVRALKQFTRTFGPEFWSNTIIALTFANTLESFNPEWKFLAPEKRAESFNEKISEWGNQIRRILTNEVKLGDELVKSIKIVPVGHYLKPHLPAIPFWLSNFWCECFSVSSPTARAALLKLNAKRFKQVHQVKPAHFKRKPQDQPIVVDEKKKILRILGGTYISASILLCGLAGAGAGGIGLLGGPIGAITIPLGFILGAAVGAGVSAFAAFLI